MIKQIILKIQQKDKRQKWRLSTFWNKIGISQSYFFSDEDELELLELESSLDDEEELNCSGWSSL